MSNNDDMNMTPADKYKVDSSEFEFNMKPREEFVSKEDDFEFNMAPAPEFVQDRSEFNFNMAPAKPKNTDDTPGLELTPSETIRDQIDRFEEMKEEVERSRENGITR